MCRSIKTLRTEPDYGDDDIRAAALQYVRKLSGYRKPSARNTAVFEQAVDEIAASTRHLLDHLQSPASSHAHSHSGVDGHDQHQHA